jgi:hypothetical protein
MRKTRTTYRILVRKPEGQRLLGRPKHRSEHNNKMVLRSIRWGGMNWTDMARIRTSGVNTVMNLLVP